MADDVFEHPRLTVIYDALDPERRDLDAYLAVADELDARRVMDVGCGTGTFALLLAERGLDVVGVDPARGSLDVARAKPAAERVRWDPGGRDGAAPAPGRSSHDDRERRPGDRRLARLARDPARRS